MLDSTIMLMVRNVLFGEFASLLMFQALSTAHPWGIKTHTELHLPNKISPEARSLLREVRCPDQLLDDLRATLC